MDRYKFLQALRSDNPKTKLFCVGDDWQSIYRFAGSDMSLFYHFEDYFGFTEKCKIETTYRLFNPLLDLSSQFIMENPNQLKKKVHQNLGKSGNTELHVMGYDSRAYPEDGNKAEKELVEGIISRIPTSEGILLLGRYNYDISVFGIKPMEESRTGKQKVKIGTREVQFMTIHGAKGLESDNIILLNCNAGTYGFPSTVSDDPIMELVLSKADDYPFAEERRVFYVALTRAKRNVYVLYDVNRPSVFVGELKPNAEIGDIICPVCGFGKVVDLGKEGNDYKGRYKLYGCNNHAAGCSYIRRVYNGYIPQGIRVDENTTTTSIRQYLRENHKCPAYRPYYRRPPVIPQMPIQIPRAPIANAPLPQEDDEDTSADDLPF